MFLKNHDDDSDDELGGGDLVVPLSLVASTPQVINGATSRPGTASMGSSDGPSEGSGRSLQYNERLARARALNEQKRKVSSNGELSPAALRSAAELGAHLPRAARARAAVSAAI